MTFVELIECTRVLTAKRAVYLRVILVLLAVALIPTTMELSGVKLRAGPHELFDFEGFYLAGQLVWRGTIEQAYHFLTLHELQKTLYDTVSFQPWSYPPQFDLLVAPLALLPLGLAYGVFTAGTLTAYLVTLRRLAAENFVSVLILLTPVIVITIRGGQNGFLTGTLIGLTCLGLRAGRSIAGLPLGLMIIKPHLAAAFAVYTLVSRRWGTAVIAAATVAATSVLATVLLGPSIWTAFVDGTKEARIFLDHGFYPLFRMVSVYAAVRSVGGPEFLANAAQVLVALLAIGSVVLASRQFSNERALGVTAIATLLISPYEYDYDLLTLGVGLSLLLPDFVRLGTNRERLAIYAASLVIGISSLIQTIILAATGSTEVLGENTHLLSVGGPALLVIFVTAWRILLRSHASRVGRIGIAVDEPAYVHANPSPTVPSM